MQQTNPMRCWPQHSTWAAVSVQCSTCGPAVYDLGKEWKLAQVRPCTYAGDVKKAPSSQLWISSTLTITVNWGMNQ